MEAIKSSVNNELANNLFDVAGLQMQFLIAPTEGTQEMCVIRTRMPPGSVVPLHSHPQPEMFYVLEGELEGCFVNDSSFEWITFHPGQSFAFERERKHALRNGGSVPVTFLVVAPSRIYEFFQELAKPAGPEPAQPTPEDLRELFSLFAQFSFWLGSPEENAAIGIALS